MTLSKRNIIFITLLISQQFWTIKIIGMSAPMMQLALIFPLIIRSFAKIEYKFYFTMLLLAIYAVLSNPNAGLQYIQYTSLFSIISLVFWLFSAALIYHMRMFVLNRATGYISIAVLAIALFAAFFTSPQALISPQDGAVGFFNEKGLFGFYLSIIFCTIYLSFNSRTSSIALVISILYLLFIIEALRTLLVYIALLLIYLESSRKNIFHMLLIAFAVLFVISLLYYCGIFDSLLLKLEIIKDNTGGIGRYAATYVIANSSFTDLMFGHGFGTYFAVRETFLATPSDIDYDYAGSFLLEMFVELGVILTSILLLGITKLIYKKVNIPLFASILILSLIGGKQDLQMLFSFIMFSLFYSRIKELCSPL